MRCYYNEIEPFAADWLHGLTRKGLIADGTIDRRSISEITPDDVLGFHRVHFFAGVGGWDYALRLAGWPADRPVWTGSCPCQPFSSAGKRKGEADERHLWPEMRRLVAECRPATIFGEQVASRDGREWLARVRADLEALGYAVGAPDLCAAGVRAPHIRQRLYWVAARLEYAPSDRRFARGPEPVGRSVASGCGNGRLGHTDRQGQRWIGPEDGRSSEAAGPGEAGWLGVANCIGKGAFEGVRRGAGAGASRGLDAWGDSRLVWCADGKTRRVGAGVQPLAYGIPRSLGRGEPELRRVARSASRNRVGRLRGYGNAIVPQVAAMFVRAFLEADRPESGE